jgi:oligopeptide/dipeptide ABC transporter ATP-binding protein
MAGTGTAHLRDPSETILRAENLVVEFPVGRTGLKVHAVSGISIDVKEGETLGLVGESGCGKSTTGRALMQFPRPTSGSVTFEGNELTALDAEELRNVRTRMQMIFQDPISSLNPRRKVGDIVSEPLAIWSTPANEERAVTTTVAAWLTMAVAGIFGVLAAVYIVVGTLVAVGVGDRHIEIGPITVENGLESVMFGALLGALAFVFWAAGRGLWRRDGEGRVAALVTYAVLLLLGLLGWTILDAPPWLVIVPAVLGLIASGLLYSPLSADDFPGVGAAGDALVDDVLTNVGLDPEVSRDKRPHEFSGGQCQRISIARALVLDPKLIICDEPVSALDVSVQAQILNLLEDMKARYGLTLIFIAHDLAVVKNVSDRVAVMYLGKLCEVAPPDLLYERAAHPYTDALLTAIPVPDPTVRPEGSADRLEGELPSPVAPPSGCRFRTRCPRAEERCAEEEPVIRRVDEGHYVACHFPLVDVADPGAVEESDAAEEPEPAPA